MIPFDKEKKGGNIKEKENTFVHGSSVLHSSEY